MTDTQLIKLSTNELTSQIEALATEVQDLCRDAQDDLDMLEEFPTASETTADHLLSVALRVAEVELLQQALEGYDGGLFNAATHLEEHPDLVDLDDLNLIVNGMTSARDNLDAMRRYQRFEPEPLPAVKQRMFHLKTGLIPDLDERIREIGIHAATLLQAVRPW